MYVYKFEYIFCKYIYLWAKIWVTMNESQWKFIMSLCSYIPKKSMGKLCICVYLHISNHIGNQSVWWKTNCINVATDLIYCSKIFLTCTVMWAVAAKTWDYDSFIISCLVPYLLLGMSSYLIGFIQKIGNSFGESKHAVYYRQSQLLMPLYA